MNEKKSNKTIELLNLNENYLTKARENKLKALRNSLKDTPVEERKEKLINKLSNDNIEFITFLRFRYKNVINKK